MSDAIVSVITYLSPLVGLSALIHTLFISHRTIHHNDLHDLHEQLERVERELVACEATRQQYYLENIELLKRLTRLETTRKDKMTRYARQHDTIQEPNGPISL